MKKRVLAGIFMMVFMLASVLGVSAANSPTANVTVDQAQQGSYIIRTGATQFDNVDAAIKADILAFNGGTKTAAEMLGNATEVKNQIANKTALTKVFDLHPENGGAPVGGKHQVKLNVPTLTDKCSGIVAIHYSVDGTNSKWEVIESSFDTANKTVTVITDDLSPIAIFATVSTGSQTGDNFQTGMWTTLAIGAAVVAAVVAAGFVFKKKHN